jgi:hypothetical protein
MPVARNSAAMPSRSSFARFVLPAILPMACAASVHARDPAAATPVPARSAAIESIRPVESASKAARTATLPAPATQPGSPWQVIDNVSQKELGGASNTQHYRSLSTSRSGSAEEGEPADKTQPNAAGSQSALPKK